jgi:hypothetical protein
LDDWIRIRVRVGIWIVVMVMVMFVVFDCVVGHREIGICIGLDRIRLIRKRVKIRGRASVRVRVWPGSGRESRESSHGIRRGFRINYLGARLI